MTKDGILFIEGRIKRMIIRHDGFKVIPRLIEDAICMNDEVKDCAVIGTKDHSHGQGQLPVAWVVLHKYEHKDIVIDNLWKLCKDNLPEYEHPQKIYVIRDLPLTPIGKIDYRELERRAEENNR